MRFRSIYLSAYHTFPQIIQTSFYGAYLNALIGRNPFNLVVAALDLKIVTFSGLVIPSVTVVTPGGVDHKLRGVIQNASPKVQPRALAATYGLPFTVSIWGQLSTMTTTFQYLV